mmetsp:Transcript_4902/g.11539  ORF Transcript_4902/g.11539 Transcript_4902/m.11539 type:complete len:205 (-) Transcript_4902:799-1413(-)
MRTRQSSVDPITRVYPLLSWFMFFPIASCVALRLSRRRLGASISWEGTSRALKCPKGPPLGKSLTSSSKSRSYHWWANVRWRRLCTAACTASRSCFCWAGSWRLCGVSSTTTPPSTRCLKMWPSGSAKSRPYTKPPRPRQRSTTSGGRRVRFPRRRPWRRSSPWHGGGTRKKPRRLAWARTRPKLRRRRRRLRTRRFPSMSLWR